MTQKTLSAVIDQDAIRHDIASLRLSAAKLRRVAERSNAEIAGQLRDIAIKCDQQADELAERLAISVFPRS